MLAKTRAFWSPRTLVHSVGTSVRSTRKGQIVLQRSPIAPQALSLVSSRGCQSGSSVSPPQTSSGKLSRVGDTLSKVDLKDNIISIDRSGLWKSTESSNGPAVPKIPSSELIREIKSAIQIRGSLSMAEYMKEVLTHPTEGFYMKRDVFGSTGDFITSPEISQMFGEMLGIWSVCLWQQMGCPKKVSIVELGPGRGTLMADFLRGTKVFTPFMAAVDVHLVEVSPKLRELQWQKLDCVSEELEGSSPRLPTRPPPLNATQQYDTTPEGIPLVKSGGDEGAPEELDGPEEPSLRGISELCGRPVEWHRSLVHVPEGPSIILANELFDALPVHQFQKTERGWCERLVTLADRSSPEHFQLMLSPGETLASRLLVEHRLKYATQEEKEKLEVLEVSSQAMALAQEIAVRVGTHGGGALLVDYGHDHAFGNSLQAIRDHQFVDLLDQPGMSDLSAYVDFAALKHCCLLAAGTSVDVHPLISQAELLHALGISARLQSLKQASTEEQGARLQAGVERLMGNSSTDVQRSGLGDRFKAMAITSKGLGVPVGFGPPEPQLT